MADSTVKPQLVENHAPPDATAAQSHPEVGSSEDIERVIDVDTCNDAAVAAQVVTEDSAAQAGVIGQNEEERGIQPSNKVIEPDTHADLMYMEKYITGLGQPGKQYGLVINEEPAKPLLERPSEGVAMPSASDGEAEFETDSSPYSSDSDSESLDGSSFSADSTDEDAESYNAEEPIETLIGEAVGSDENSSVAADVRRKVVMTANEKPPEVIPKPDITVTQEMKLQELGYVQFIVENEILIKANTSGEFQVLDSGSLLCLENRSVIGVVAETIGNVQQPYYSARFTNIAAILEAGISKDSRIFYVPEHSTYIFTQSLKAAKGTDASNLYDEEVGDDEIEFSDDEAEAEYKRRFKAQAKAKRERLNEEKFPKDQSGSVRARVGKKGRGSGYRPNLCLPPKPNGPPPDPVLNYDDDQPSNELYTPLARPTGIYGMDGTGSSASPSHLTGGFLKQGRGRGTGHNGDSTHSSHISHGHRQSNGRVQKIGTPFPISYPGQAEPSPYQHHLPQQFPYAVHNHTDGNYLPQHQAQSYYHAQYQPHQPYQLQNGWQAHYPSYGQPQGYLAFNHTQTHFQGLPHIPPGSHVNPAFFRQHSQGLYNPSWQPQNHQQHYG